MAPGRMAVPCNPDPRPMKPISNTEMDTDVRCDPPGIDSVDVDFLSQLEQAPDGMVIADDRGEWVWVNAVAARLLGYSRSELVGQTGVNVLPGWPTGYALPAIVKVMYRYPDGTMQPLAVEYISLALVPSLHLFILHKLPSTRYLKEMQTRTLFNLLPVGVVITDVAGMVSEINPIAMQLLGVTHHPHFCLLSDERQVWDEQGEFLPVVQRVCMRAWHEHRVLNNQVQEILRPDGTRRWGSVSAAPLPNGGIAVTYVDLTPQKQLALTLERKIAQEQTLAAVMQAIRSSLDLTEVFTVAATTISQRFQVETGIVQYHPEQACWQYQIRCLPTGELAATDTKIPDHNNPFAQRLKNHQIVQIDDSTTITDPVNQNIASQFPGAWLLVPIGVSGTVWGSLTWIRPVESSPWQPDEVILAQRLADQLGMAIEQAEMYQQVQASQRESRFLMDNCPASIVHWRLLPNYRWEYEYISPSDERIFGYSAQTFFDNLELWQQRIVPEDWQHIVVPALQRIYQGENHASIYFRFQHPAGKIIWVHETMAVQFRFSPACISLISVLVDVTDLKSAQTQVEELAHLNRLKDDFVSTVSHELRTPLTNIQMATKMLELTLKRQGLLTDDGETSLSKYFHILQSQTQQEINLVNDLLDFTRLESQGRCPTCIPTDLRACLPPLLEPFRERATQQRQTLHLEFPEDLPPALAHAPYLERVINELLGNACKYTPAGERIILAGASQGDQVSVRVTNTGVEIPQAEQSRIFERFYRIPQHDPWQQGGTGLGLALVKELVEQMGGAIGLETGAGQTCFTVTLRRV